MSHLIWSFSSKLIHCQTLATYFFPTSQIIFIFLLFSVSESCLVHSVLFSVSQAPFNTVFQHFLSPCIRGVVGTLRVLIWMQSVKSVVDMSPFYVSSPWTCKIANAVGLASGTCCVLFLKLQEIILSFIIDYTIHIYQTSLVPAWVPAEQGFFQQIQPGWRQRLLMLWWPGVGTSPA